MQGVLLRWVPTAKGGYGIVLASRRKYLLHKSEILAGAPVAGAKVDFEPSPPTDKGPLDIAKRATIQESKTALTAVRNILGSGK